MDSGCTSIKHYPLPEQSTTIATITSEGEGHHVTAVTTAPSDIDASTNDTMITMITQKNDASATGGVAAESSPAIVPTTTTEDSSTLEGESAAAVSMEEGTEGDFVADSMAPDASVVVVDASALGTMTAAGMEVVVPQVSETSSPPKRKHEELCADSSYPIATEEANQGLPMDVDTADSVDADVSTTEVEYRTSASEAEDQPFKRMKTVETALADDHQAWADAEELAEKVVAEANASPLALPPQKKVNNWQWDTMFKRLEEYKEIHGDCLVPKRYAADPRLGTWVETQRVQYKRLPRTFDQARGVEVVQPNKRLNEERLNRLESIGFAWSAKNLRKPKQQQRASPSPTGEVAPSDYTAIVQTSSPITNRQGASKVANAGLKKAPPNAVGDMSLSCSSSTANRTMARQRLNEAQWEDMYQRLKEYKELYGNCLVPRRYEKDPKLATWVETQRVLWNRDHKQGAAAANICEGNPGTAKTNETFTASKNQMWQADVAVAGSSAAPRLAGEDDGGAASQSIKRLTAERKKKLDDIGFVWSLRSKRIEDHWDEMFRQLVDYKDKHGDCLVPSRFEENLKLGKWVETQRYEYTKLQRASDKGKLDSKPEASEPQSVQAVGAEGSASVASKPPRAANPRLTEDRLRRLESIGFEWKVKHKMKRYYDKQWDQMFERLLAFKASTGHCMVPKRYPPDMKLGTWVHTQRIQYRKLISGTKKGAAGEADMADRAELEEAFNELKKSGEEEVSYRLTEARRKRLEQVGFVWSAREGEKGSEVGGRITRNSYDDQWDSMFERLKEYKQKHGHCLVPKRYKEFPKLGTWVDTQRVQFKKLKKKLAFLGRTYEGPTPPVYNDDSDDSNTNVKPAEASEDGTTPAMAPKPLVGRLTDDRIRRLQELGFVWSLRDDWDKHYEELQEFRKVHGHCNVPARYPQNRRLGIWVSAQRQQFKIMKQTQDAERPRRSAPLTQDRINLLNLLGFTWTIRSRDSLGESWNQRLEELKAFKKKTGHCLVPSRYHLNPELGIWVGTQRTQYRLFKRAKETGTSVTGGTSMNEDRIRELEQLGFVFCVRGGEGKDSELAADSVALTSSDMVDTESSGPDQAIGDSVIKSAMDVIVAQGSTVV